MEGVPLAFWQKHITFVFPRHLNPSAQEPSDQPVPSPEPVTPEVIVCVVSLHIRGTVTGGQQPVTLSWLGGVGDLEIFSAEISTLSFKTQVRSGWRCCSAESAAWFCLGQDWCYAWYCRQTSGA